MDVQPAVCCGGFQDILPGDKVPMGRVLLFRDVHGNEWLGQNRLDGPNGERASMWSFFR